ncbi:MAG TPA: phosphatase PAP2 family protein [Rhizomicrobium sp.]|nr:phosphatase PAP2 family protein [Rhizomicrobium sp.]
MLLWVGLLFVASGIGCVAIDRRATHFIYDHVDTRLHGFLNATTHLAKAAHWLIAAVAAYAVCWCWLSFGQFNAAVKLALNCALAFIIGLGAGSALLHATKLVLGRRRPRDELEMKLYGFVLFGFDLSMNSFPSGHALTIACVAVVATALWPHLALLWFAIALWLALTRALLSAHFLSDVLVGFGAGLISAREVLVNLFPALAPSWF